jgi:hypothetical protein
MRIAACALCLFFLPAVADGQRSLLTDPAVSTYPRSTFFVGPSFRNTTATTHVVQRPMTRQVPMQGTSAGTYWVNDQRPVVTASPNPPGRYFYLPHYPSLSFVPPADVRPQEYVIPPVTQTPLHDPYFEERVYDPYEDDPYDVWGW